MELREFLLWIFAGGGGAAAIAYWVMERLADTITNAEYRRYLSLALAAVLAWAAFAAAVGLGYVDNPGDWQGWLEMLFSLAFAAIVGSQAVHGRFRLRR